MRHYHRAVLEGCRARRVAASLPPPVATSLPRKPYQQQAMTYDGGASGYAVIKCTSSIDAVTNIMSTC